MEEHTHIRHICQNRYPVGTGRKLRGRTEDGKDGGRVRSRDGQGRGFNLCVAPSLQNRCPYFKGTVLKGRRERSENGDKINYVFKSITSWGLVTSHSGLIYTEDGGSGDT